MRPTPYSCILTRKTESVEENINLVAFSSSAVDSGSLRITTFQTTV